VTFLCFSDRRYHHFDTTKVIEAEAQGVLNKTTRVHFKRWQKRLEWHICMEEEYFDQMAKSVPEIMDRGGRYVNV
jgi:hypothetical protein